MKSSIARQFFLASLLLFPSVNCSLADITEPVDYHIAWTNSAGPWVVIKNDLGYGNPIWTNGNSEVWIDNIETPDYDKTVWLEVDYVSQTYFPTNPIILSSQLGAIISSPTITTNSASLTWMWTIDPQPAWEMIAFPDASYINLTGINRIDIATRCIPEPSTMVLVSLGLAGLAFATHRRGSK
jgi:hypothetical protein